MFERYIEPKSVIVDCTLGNGHDSAFIASRYPKTKLYGLDISQEAIAKSKELLKEFTNIEILQHSHDKLDSLDLSEVSLFIYNLGYLPNANEHSQTNYQTTISSLKQALKLLKVKGGIVITLYQGHDSAKEYNFVYNFIENLDKKTWIAMSYKPVNLSQAPCVVVIERKN